MTHITKMQTIDPQVGRVPGRNCRAATDTRSPIEGAPARLVTPARS